MSDTFNFAGFLCLLNEFKLCKVQNLRYIYLTLYIKPYFWVTVLDYNIFTSSLSRLDDCNPPSMLIIFSLF